MRDRFKGEGTVNKCKNKIAILSSMFLSMGAIAIEDPLKGLHNVSPHDDLLSDTTFFNNTTRILYPRMALHEVLSKQGFGVEQGFDIKSTSLSMMDFFSEPTPEIVAARLFSTATDVTLAIAPNYPNLHSFSVAVYDKKFQTNVNHVPLVKEALPEYQYKNQKNKVVRRYNPVKADFNGSGTEQVIALGDARSIHGRHIVLIKAQDVTKPSEGISISTIYESAPKENSTTRGVYGRPVVGDLTGDGNQEIVMTKSQFIDIYTVCSGSYSNRTHSVCNNSDGTSKPEFTVIRHTNESTFKLPVATTSVAYDLSIGNFYGDGNVLSVTSTGHNNRALIDLYRVENGPASGLQITRESFDNNFQSHITGGYSRNGGYCFAKAAKKFLNDVKDQLWLACQSETDGINTNNGSMVTLLQLDFYKDEDNRGRFNVLSKSTPFGVDHWRLRGMTPYYPMTFPTDRALEDTDFINSMALLLSSNVDTDSNMYKIVLLQSNQSIDGDKRSHIFPQAHTNEQISRYDVSKHGGHHILLPFRAYQMLRDDSRSSRVFRAKNMLSTGDFTGQSVRLGAPLYYKTPIMQEPFTVIGAPPAHVDFTLPFDNNNPSPDIRDNRVVNLSMDPDSYMAKFEKSATVSHGYTEQKITSLTNSVTTQASAEGGAGGGVLSPVKASFSVTAGGGYLNEKTADKVNENTDSQSVLLSFETGFQDRVGINNQYDEHFAYPVLGGGVCLEGDDCVDSEKGQQYVMYTRTSEPQRSYLDGGQVAWYQPVHEVNNVLSYPRSLAQLEANYGNPIKALSQQNTFYTSTGSSLFELSWLNGSTSSDTNTVLNKGMWNAGFNATYGTNDKSVFIKATGISYENKFEVKYEGSVTKSGVVTNVSEYEAGAKVSVVLPNTFASPAAYSYGITPVVFDDIFNQQDMDVNDPFLSKAVKETINNSNSGALSAGYLKLGHYVNHSDNVGTWWRAKKGLSKIDIGLNNPTRWDKDESTHLDESGSNCLNRFVCAVPFQPTIAGHENFDSFYNMRGLFVTPKWGNTTRHEADEGEKLTLSARIYNYSLTDMPVNSEVHVQFYRQSVAHNGNLAPNSAELIGETWIPALRGANYKTAAHDNWALASVDWGTSGQAGQYHFWVVAWAEDAQGNMLTELPGKGLADNHTSPLFRDISDVPLQYVTLDSPSLGQVEMTFTNNVGMYPQEFTVVPENSPAFMATSALSHASLTKENDKLPSLKGMLLNPITISLNHQDERSVNIGLSAPHNTQSQLIYISDDKDNIVSMQRLGRIYKHKNINIPFTLKECGRNALTVRVGSPTNEAIASYEFSANLQCH
ncbi:hypothetical protein [Shewanella surugensis]|uniref:Uncharacterized protein n=1 Tax=Shewanella surugensis TaxID=212020 RepID=A0ABT0LIZ1_9GAMM|nr:hypothetical protein [Shewanella surugensis]MCL1127678.1 hypothetical protein [Shewanella surugensis]